VKLEAALIQINGRDSASVARRVDLETFPRWKVTMKNISEQLDLD